MLAAFSPYSDDFCDFYEHLANVCFVLPALLLRGSTFSVLRAPQPMFFGPFNYEQSPNRTANKQSINFTMI